MADAAGIPLMPPSCVIVALRKLESASGMIMEWMEPVERMNQERSTPRADMSRTRACKIAGIYRSCSEPLYMVLDGISEEDLRWAPAPESRSIGEMTRHIIRVDGGFLKRLGVETQVPDPGDVSADDLLAALRTIHMETHAILDLCDDDSSLDRALDGGEEHETPGGIILHMAQHYLYHLAQMIYLRRARDRSWESPMKEWEHATHVIARHLAGR